MSFTIQLEFMMPNVVCRNILVHGRKDHTWCLRRSCCTPKTLRVAAVGAGDGEDVSCRKCQPSPVQLARCLSSFALVLYAIRRDLLPPATSHASRHSPLGPEHKRGLDGSTTLSD